MGPRFWFSRTAVPAEILVCVVIVSWLEPSSLTARAINATGPFGWCLVFMLGATCAISLLDVLFNDIAPVRLLPWVRNWRHLGFLAMAMLLAMLGVLIAFATEGFTALLLMYWLNVILAGALAFLDVFARHRLLP